MCACASVYYVVFDSLHEFSHKLMSKIQPVVTRWKNTTPEGKRTRYSPYKMETAMVHNTRKKRHLQKNKEETDKNEHRKLLA